MFGITTFWNMTLQTPDTPYLLQFFPFATFIIIKYLNTTTTNTYLTLDVACWPLVPKFAGLHLAEAIGFLGQKNPQHAFLHRGSKVVGPMS
jgi:hypothetical protein